MFYRITMILFELKIAIDRITCGTTTRFMDNKFISMKSLWVNNVLIRIASKKTFKKNAFILCRLMTRRNIRKKFSK